MKNYFLLTFLLYSLTCKSQYESFIRDSAVWTISEDDIETLWIDNYFGYYMNGDTIISGKQYKKTSRLFFRNDAPNWSSPYQVDSMKVVAYIREENKMIYAIKDSSLLYPYNCPNNTEFLLYDFNITIGSLISWCIQSESPDTVNNIEISSPLNRKKYITQGGMGYIEGIGNENGLFEDTFIGIGGSGVNLVNYCIGTLSECNLATFTPLKDNKKVTTTVYPNPSKQNFNIILPHENMKYSMEFYSINGMKVIQKIIHSSGSYEVNLNAGTYILKIFNNNGEGFHQLHTILD